MGKKKGKNIEKKGKTLLIFRKKTKLKVREKEQKEKRIRKSDCLEHTRSEGT